MKITAYGSTFVGSSRINCDNYYISPDKRLLVLADISDELFVEAGRLKSLYKVSFADTFALATASVSGGILLTADHHEMDKVEQIEPGIKFRWIR
jgi:predicted nucleic acid-binding protein